MVVSDVNDDNDRKNTKHNTERERMREGRGSLSNFAARIEASVCFHLGQKNAPRTRGTLLKIRV